jgi:hypothetical protein
MQQVYMRIDSLLEMSLHLRKVPHSLVTVANLINQALMPNLEFRLVALYLGRLSLTRHPALHCFEMLDPVGQLHPSIHIFLFLVVEHVGVLSFLVSHLGGPFLLLARQTILNCDVSCFDNIPLYLCSLMHLNIMVLLALLLLIFLDL